MNPSDYIDANKLHSEVVSAHNLDTWLRCNGEKAIVSLQVFGEADVLVVWED